MLISLVEKVQENNYVLLTFYWRRNFRSPRCSRPVRFHSFIHSLAHWLADSLTHARTHLLGVRSLAYLTPTNPTIRSVGRLYSLTRTVTHTDSFALAHARTHSLTHSPARLLLQFILHPSTHPFVHSFSHRHACSQAEARASSLCFTYFPWFIILRAFKQSENLPRPRGLVCQTVSINVK